MIEKLRGFLEEKTNGVIHTNQEVVYLLVVIVLAVVLVFNLMYRMSL